MSAATINGLVQAPPSREHHSLTESTKLFIDAAPAVITAAICRLDLAAPVVRALTALDLPGRFALLPTRVGGNGAGDPAIFGMIWRTDARETAQRIRPAEFESFASPGYIKMRGTVEVVASDAGALLSIAMRFEATDDRSAARLLDAWSVVGPLSHALRERAAHAVRDFAEDLAGE
jgi:hypothetical protein